jgi:hypothetical protein
VKTGGRATFDPSIQCLRVNDAVNICFGVAKWRKYEGRRAVRWTLRRRVRQPPGWIVAIRLGENNESILDYILLPSTSLTAHWLWISEEGRPAHKIERFETLEELARSLIKRVNKALRGALNKRRRSKAAGSTKGRWS